MFYELKVREQGENGAFVVEIPVSLRSWLFSLGTAVLPFPNSSALKS